MADHKEKNLRHPVMIDMSLSCIILPFAGKGVVSEKEMSGLGKDRGGTTRVCHRRSLRRLTATAFFLFCFLPATTQTVRAQVQVPVAPIPSAKPPAGLWERETLLDDMGGLRTFLGHYGISIGLTETSEVLGNVTGGVHRGAVYDGLTMMTLSLDTDKACHWSGGTFLVSALQIHGGNLSSANLYNLQTVSGITADRTTRLWELWYQQAFLGGQADLKIGQQSLDQEFIVSRYCGLFLNTMMGWPMLPSADLYAGGPAYPLSSLGIRLRVKPNESLTLLGGVFNDNPPGGPFNDDSQLRDREASGTRFNMNTGALLIAELQYAVHQSESEKSRCNNLTCGLSGIFKLGLWYDTASFPDQRFDKDDLSLANPASRGIPRLHRGNFSIYGIIDQEIWRQSDGPRSVCGFVRIMGAPADRNLIDYSLNAGVNLKAPLRGRDNDTFGIGYGWAHVSGSASDLDEDTERFSGQARPIRGSEHFIELTYQCQITPWWVVQPDLQYIINPGGGIPNPLKPTELIGNELVLGLRTIITF
jgi:porin